MKTIRTLAVACGAAYLLGFGTAHAQAVADPANYSRASSFEYDATTGLLTGETVQPDNPQLCVKTTHAYDGYGNRTGSTTANCQGATGKAVFDSRAIGSKYEAQGAASGAGALELPAGTAATWVQNALGHAETRTIDPRFGAVKSVTGPNGLASSAQYDDFGRVVRATGTDGTSVVTAYCLLAGRVEDTTSNSTDCPSPGAGELRSDAVSFVHTEPRSVADAKFGPARRVYSDRAGRTIRTVTEAFDGAAQPRGTARLVVEDVDYDAHGLVVVATQPYFLDSGSSTADGSESYGMTLTVYNAVGAPAEVYTTDAKGSHAAVAFGSRGTRTAARTRIWNSGLTAYRANDKEETTTEEKNVDGKVVRVTDPDGAQVAHVYDAFGNLIESRDPLGNKIVVKYDVRARKLSMDDPDAGTTTYDYNALGEMVYQKSARGHESTFAYDKLGRMTRRVEAEYTTDWTFDRYADGSACTAGIGKLCEVVTSHGVRRRHAYDAKGRPLGTRTDIASGPSFASGVQYDANGRVSRQVYPSGLTVEFGYTAMGFVETLRTATAATLRPLPASAGGTAGASVSLPAGTLLWKAQSVNAWGKMESQAYGNGIVGTLRQDAQTGRASGIAAGAGFAKDVVDYGYEWNSVGQLKVRTDALGDGTTGAVTDTYDYDAVGRLRTYTVAAPAIPALERTVTMQHNAAGALLLKSDVGIYTYPQQGGAAKRPHSLASVAGAVSASYGYDDGGNMTSASGGTYRTIAYTSFGLPDSEAGIAGPAGSPRYTWLYDEGHQRLKEVRVNAAGTRTTWMLHPDNAGGLGFESAVEGATTSNRHYLSVGGTALGVLVSEGALPSPGTALVPQQAASIALVKSEYWHKDIQGTLLATTDHTGAVTARYAYDPYGKRRTASGNYDAEGKLVYDWNRTNSGTDRGYTGHEHLDDVGVVHMNGRTFDPTLAIFMQPDPIVQDPMNTQNYNRYGYCFGDPMTCSDPTGYSFFRNLNKISVRAWDPAAFYINRRIAQTRVGYQVGSIAITVFSGYCNGAAAACNMAGQAAWAGLSGRTFEESVRIGVISGLTSAAMGYVGDTWAVGENASGFDKFMNTVGHAAVGCAQSVGNGGACRDGALGGAFSAAWGTYGPGYIEINAPRDIVANAMISAGVGGISSVITGGNFAAGAKAGAYGYMYNFLVHIVYSLSTQRLTVTDLDTGETATGQFKNATEKGVPTTEGYYDILQGTTKKGSERYRLERLGDRIYGDDLDGTTGQVNIRLHGPGDSWGCITACSASDWRSVYPVIAGTRTRFKTVMSIYDITGAFESSAFGNQYTRFPNPRGTGWERIKWYGILRVTK